ncbi:nucleotidyltransferase [Spirochaetia bacterium]|nr:nucleotidyltransferase [Spirochaetia bacterium]GHU31884.1 nucleotidyltransferase [Spirochaetia bacterium]
MILVVLAAGMGSRYGGLKQMEAFGAGGEALLDYSVYDARRAGFDKVVFVIRHDFEDDFRNIVLARIGKKIECNLAFQSLDALIPADILENAQKAGRTTPWGTVHALLSGESAIDGPFTVINADDFYGREAFLAMGRFFATNPHEGALVPYTLTKILSPQGAVTRGICTIIDGYLSSIHEMFGIIRDGDAILSANLDGTKTELAPDSPVSMNFWGFPADIFGDLHVYFDDFLRKLTDPVKSECYLPLFADWLVQTKRCAIRSLSADSEWFGVTYQGDRERTTARIAELIAEGVYPDSLWKA